MRPQQALVGIGFGLTGENQLAPVRRGQMRVTHLRGGKILKHHSWGEAAGEWFAHKMTMATPAP